MAALLLALAAVILVLGVALLGRSLPIVEGLGELVRRYPRYVAAAAVLLIVGGSVLVLQVMNVQSERVTVEGGCRKAHVDAFGTHWLGSEPAAMIPKPVTGPWEWSSSGVIHRRILGDAVFTPDGGGAHIVFHENRGGFITTDCAPQ
jgi:hypothetical protein